LSRGATSKTFICRRGCDTRLATYTEEFVWEDLFIPSEEGVRELIKFVQEHTTLQTCTNLGHRQNAMITISQDTLDKSEHRPDYVHHIYGNNRKQTTFTPLSTTTSIRSDATSVYQIARASLHASALPPTLPCREHEFREIFGRLAEAIVDGAGNCIYISGTPGTGKTATVREVIASLERAVVDNELDDFIFVEVNGMKLTDPNQAYTLLWEALRNQRVSPAQALGLLERELNNPSPRRVPCVVLMDELDQMVTKNQGIMYNFFHWPSLRHSKLIVLAVANTMDLPERTLSNKISSRIGKMHLCIVYSIHGLMDTAKLLTGLTRITFPGYTHEQLMKIIRARLGGTVGNLIEDDAIQFASRKIAAVSGDARRALDICRRAVEIAETDNMTNSHVNQVSPPRVKVSITTIMQAIQEATSNPITTHIRSLPSAAKLVLFAILLLTRRSGVTETSVAEVSNVLRECVNISPLLRSRLRYATFELGSSANDEMPDQHAYVDGLCIKYKLTELCSAGIVTLDSSRMDRPGSIRLLLGSGDASIALNEDEEMTELLSYMRAA
jgi:origin recognition complex subunit 1